MKTYGFIYEEKLTFHKEIKIETDLSEEELLNVIDKVERHSESTEDIAYALAQYDNIKIIGSVDSDYSSPVNVEVEYYDHI